MSNFSRITVTIGDGGTGRLPAGKDWYTGVIFQNATKPVAFGTGNIVRVYSLNEAITKGITQALFPVEYYHISEYFRILALNSKEAFLDVGIYPIVLDTFDGAEIDLMQANANGELRQIGVYLIDAYKVADIGICNVKATALDDAGTPTSIYFSSDIADADALIDLRSNDYKWVSTILGQDGEGAGAALYLAQGYSIGCIGAVLGQTAISAVHEFIGIGARTINGSTEFQVPALADGQLVKDKTKTQIQLLTQQGYTLAVPIQSLGTCFDTDAVTAASETSDFQEQSANRVIGKIKRKSILKLAPDRNIPLYVDPTTGKLKESTMQYFISKLNNTLLELATANEINTDENGNLPKNSVTIDPEQNVIATNTILINVKASKVGAASNINVTLGYAVTIN